VFCPFREDDLGGRLAPKSEATASTWVYAYQKRRCELALIQAWEGGQFPYTSLRLPMVVGPGDYTERALAYLERLADGGPLILPDGGLNSWGFLCVTDVAETIAANLMNSNTLGRAYNLAQREIVSLRQFVETAAAALEQRPGLVALPGEWLTRLGLPGTFSPYSHDHDIVLDTTNAHTDLLFEPTPFVAWCEQLARDFRRHWDGQHSRLYATRQLELRIVAELSQVRVPGVAALD
jgi:nucleoside-diphosphate-sugar epimerase